VCEGHRRMKPAPPQVTRNPDKDFVLIYQKRFCGPPMGPFPFSSPCRCLRIPTQNLGPPVHLGLSLPRCWRLLKKNASHTSSLSNKNGAVLLKTLSFFTNSAVRRISFVSMSALFSPPGKYQATLLALHTSGPRDVPRCGALSLLQKAPHYRGVG
jgi:hypothetical protein